MKIHHQVYQVEQNFRKLTVVVDVEIKIIYQEKLFNKKQFKKITTIQFILMEKYCGNYQTNLLKY